MYGESGGEVGTAPNHPPHLTVESDGDVGTAPGHLPPLMIITTARGDAGTGTILSHPPCPHLMVTTTGIGTAPNHPCRPHPPPLGPHHPLHQVASTDQGISTD